MTSIIRLRCNKFFLSLILVIDRMYPDPYSKYSLPHGRNNSTTSINSSHLQNPSYNQYAAAGSRNPSHPQNPSYNQYAAAESKNPSHPQNSSYNQYAAAESKNLNYQQNQSQQDRKYHASNEQLMVGLDKFVRKYESEFFSPMKICDDVQILSIIYSQ